MKDIHAKSNEVIGRYIEKKKKKLTMKAVNQHLDSFWKKYGVNNQFNIMDLGKIPTAAKKILEETGDVESADKAYSEAIEYYKVKFV
jgi:hypothetical protein